MVPGHKLSVDGPRPHTLVDMLQDHTVSVDGSRPHTLNRWPHATQLKLMAPGHTLQMDDPRSHTLTVLVGLDNPRPHTKLVCGLGPSI